MKDKENKLDIKRPRTHIIMALFCAAAFAVMELVLTPIYIALYSDITVGVIWSYIIEILLNLTEIFTFAVCYSLIAYAAVLRKWRNTVTLCLVYAVATLARRAASLLITYFSSGGIDGYDIRNVGIYLIFELAEVTVVAVIALVIGTRYNRELNEKKKAALILNTAINDENTEFSKIYSKENPLQRILLLAGIMLIAVNVGMRVFYDISYGAPSGVAEVLLMAAYYLSDILKGVVFYAAACFFTSRLIKKYRCGSQDSIL